MRVDFVSERSATSRNREEIQIFRGVRIERATAQLDYRRIAEILFIDIAYIFVISN